MLFVQHCPHNHPYPFHQQGNIASSSVCISSIAYAGIAFLPPSLLVMPAAICSGYIALVLPLPHRLRTGR